MRVIIEQGEQRAILILSALSGLLQTIIIVANYGHTMNVSSGILWLMLPLGALGGVVYVYVGGAFLKWSGNWLGGKGSYYEVRSFLAWSGVTAIASFLLELCSALLFGHNQLFPITPLVQSGTVLFVILNPL